MPDGEEFYLAPIRLGYYTYPDLLQGPLSIEHVAEINDCMAYEYENQRRAAEKK